MCAIISYLSTAIAAKVFTDAQTETPCKYGVALHMNQPKCHSETKGRISVFSEINLTFIFAVKKKIKLLVMRLSICDHLAPCIYCFNNELLWV